MRMHIYREKKKQIIGAFKTLKQASLAPLAKDFELEDSSEVKGERAEDNSNVSGDIRDTFCDGLLLQKKLKVLKSI